MESVGVEIRDSDCTHTQADRGSMMMFEKILLLRVAMTQGVGHGQ